MSSSKYFAITVLILFGCSDSELEKPDTEIPLIALINSNPDYGTDDICGLPETHVFPLLSEQTLYLELNFSDDVELSQYKIDIHHNFDCHTHGRIREVGEPWFVARIEKLEGRRQTIKEELTVPANVAAGNYHLIFYALDKVGNEAEPLVFSMKIKNKNDTQPPSLTLTEPPSTGVTLRKEESVHFKGTITDNTDLTDGRIELFYYDPDNTLFTANQYLFSEEVGTEFNFDIPFTIESTSSAGVHKFHVKAYDRYNNSMEEVIPITIE